VQKNGLEIFPGRFYFVLLHITIKQIKMKTIKLNNEKFTSEQIDQIQAAYSNLSKLGYEPKMIGLPTETAATIEHNDDNGNRIKVMLISRNGQLTGVQI